MTISYDDFSKVEIRVGTIVDVQPYPEARKPAYKLAVDFGPELGVKKSSAQCTVVYAPPDLLGRQVALPVLEALECVDRTVFVKHIPAHPPRPRSVFPAARSIARNPSRSRLWLADALFRCELVHARRWRACRVASIGGELLPSYSASNRAIAAPPTTSPPPPPIPPSSISPL